MWVLSNHASLACITFIALELSSDIKIIKIVHCLYYIFLTLRLCYAKTICLISFRLTVFNKDTLRYLHINFLSNWISFKVAINIYNI